MKNLRYIFPETTNFREERPKICWEHMYGWIEGYGVLFDPLVYSATEVIPEWENGWNGNADENDFIVTSCVQASACFSDLDIPGIYIRPSAGVKLTERFRDSEKERIHTPAGNFFYPFGLPFDRFAEGSVDWQLAGSPAVAKNAKSIGVCFELFAMFGNFRNEMFEQAFTTCADIIAALLDELGISADKKVMEEWQAEMRIDFQAYGLNRLFVQSLLLLDDRDKNRIAEADGFYKKAVEAWNSRVQAEAAENLKKAFEGLLAVRKSISNIDVLFLEYPHMGILFEDKGFFELEWPERSKKMMFSYFKQLEKQDYKVAMEGGASCWKNITKRYPDLGKKLKELWNENRIELTNGTFSLPYALMSPLSLQYWQFRKGKESFEKTFGRFPETYQCQENSLTPQMPELLEHFGYKQALHVTQNRGEAPSEKDEFIKWVSPAGHGLPALTAPNPVLTRKGNNYFLDIALIHHEYKDKLTTLNYINFQDLGYVPFRIHMIKAHKYAPVWGRFALTGDVFKNLPEHGLEEKSYMADSYKFSEKYFYANETNVNSISTYEQVYALTASRRQLLFAAKASGILHELFDDINSVIENICLLEAHDCCYVQGQRRGEFHSRDTIETPPYSRDTLTQKIAEIVSEVNSSLSKAGTDDLCQEATSLYNAGEVTLDFARVRNSEMFSGKGLVRIDDAAYACGCFDAFSAATPAETPESASFEFPFDNGIWKIESSSSDIKLSYKGRQLSFRPVDRKNGRFELLNAELSKEKGLNIARFFWTLENPHLQSAITTVIFTDSGDYCEIRVKYTPRNDFATKGQWNDHLAIEFNCGSALENVYRFNPNVQSMTVEKQVVSPYYLKGETASGETFNFMNEGAVLYDVDKPDGIVNWLFHAACETVCERRMGIAFGGNNTFQLSRAWGQGLIPINIKGNQFTGIEHWRGVSFEDFISADEMLVSNLKDTDCEFPASGIISAENLAGENILDNSKIKLKPFELALLTIKKDCLS